MFLLSFLLLVIAVYFAKKSYYELRIVPAMLWSFLAGWDLHALLTFI
jgi:hypothetical protein